MQSSILFENNQFEYSKKVFPLFLEADRMIMPQEHKRLKYEIQIAVPGKENLKRFFDAGDPLFSLTR